MMTRQLLAGLVFLLAAALMAACALPRAPRTADVLAPGVMEAGISGGGGFGDASMQVEDFGGTKTEQSASSGFILTNEDQIEVTTFSNLLLHARLGLFDPCELGVDLGLGRLGGEFRCKTLDADGDWGPDLTWWANGAYNPIGGWDAGTGLDLSRWFGDLFAPFVNLGFDFGLRHHVMPLDERFGRPDTDRLQAVIDEVAVRVTVAFGGAFKFGDDADNATILSFGIAPHFKVWSLNPPGVDCDDCVRVNEISEFDELYGIVFLVTFGQRFRIWGE